MPGALSSGRLRDGLLVVPAYAMIRIANGVEYAIHIKRLPTMRSSFLNGLIGFILVLSVLFGGMVGAKICQELLTPNLAFCYMIWLWICSIPFWWLCCISLAPDHIKHPAATYVGLLPFL